VQYNIKMPRPELLRFIKCFWMADSEGKTSIKREKIVPDGYPEMMFDYGLPYRANITGEWYTQGTELIAGQIRNHFYLENTGRVGIMAIKFQPWALRLLFGLDMVGLVDNVIDIESDLRQELHEVQTISCSKEIFENKVTQLEEWFMRKIDKQSFPLTGFEKATKELIQSNGQKSLKELSKKYAFSERSLERYFKEYIGLTPKFYSRILRFSYIFNLLQDNKEPDWSDISLEAGFYDQSHFIKNFKEFTGENP